MKLPEYVKYAGRMKQPLQKSDVDRPTMFVVADSLKHQLCLILLTPCTYAHAYRFIQHSNVKSVRLFVPSLRPEFISDVLNLYVNLKDKVPIKWVFPERFNYYTFSLGQERTEVYFHPYNPQLSIEYIQNPNVDHVYDILVKSQNGTHYFSMYMTEQRFKELYYCREYTQIHLPKSSTIYGGMTYDMLFEMDKHFKRKMVPHDFASIEEYYTFMGRDIPDIDAENIHTCKCQECRDKEEFDIPEPYEVTDDEIMDMISSVDMEEGDGV